MKRLLLMLAFAFLSVIGMNAADISYYNQKYEAEIAKFQAGLNESNDYYRMMHTLDTLVQEFKNDAAIAVKEPLLSEITAFHHFVAELSMTNINYEFTSVEKQKIFAKLGIQETVYNDSVFCLPIKVIKLWDRQSCFFVENDLDSFMVNFKVSFGIQRKFSETSGSVEGGVSRKACRFLYTTNSAVSLTFKQEKCDKELQIEKVIKQEVIQPPVEKYPDPDYLSPAQKKALAKKEKEKLKKEKSKAKAQALKDKEKKKKDLIKEKALKQKEMQEALKAQQQSKAAQSQKPAPKKEDPKKKKKK